MWTKTYTAKDVTLHALRTLIKKVESLGTQEVNYTVFRKTKKTTEMLMEYVDLILKRGNRGK